jgi:hypothetical protein
MPIPTAYTEADLAAYMHRRLDAVAAALGWLPTGGANGTGAYDEPVIDTLLAYGVTSLAAVGATPVEIAKLRALAERAAWRAASAAAAGLYDWSSDSQSEHLSDVAKQTIAAGLALAEAKAAPYGDDLGQHTARRARVLPYPDPYANTVWGTRGLETLEPGVIVALPGPVVVPTGAGDFAGS